MIDIEKKHDNRGSDHFITVNDYGAKTEKTKPASEFPESMRFIEVRSSSDAQDNIKRVAVKNIIIRPLDDLGNLVDMSQATVVSIQYLDDKGNVLLSTTMQKN